MDQEDNRRVFFSIANRYSLLKKKKKSKRKEKIIEIKKDMNASLCDIMKGVGISVLWNVCNVQQVPSRRYIHAIIQITKVITIANVAIFVIEKLLSSFSKNNRQGQSEK